jgi:predicted RNA-binding protein with PUA-like domain
MKTDKKYWLLKTEPEAFSFSDLQKQGESCWDGVRNYQARNNLKEMQIGDTVLIYHSVQGKEVVGIAEVAKEFFQDPTTDDNRWVAVNIRAIKPLANPVRLDEIKQHEKLQNLLLVRHSRLSVMPVKKDEFEIILQLSQKD